MSFDKEDVYDHEIAPLMTQLIHICKKHEIPMLAQFQYADTEEEGPAYCTTALPIGEASPRFREIAASLKPAHHVALAETIVTMPDGSKQISIRRMP